MRQCAGIQPDLIQRDEENGSQQSKRKIICKDKQYKSHHNHETVAAAVELKQYLALQQDAAHTYKGWDK